MTFATQSTVSFGDTWSDTQHNVMINNDIHLNTAFHVPLFPLSSGLAASSGVNAPAYSVVQSSGAGTIKPEFPILSFDASTDEGRIWNGMLPRGYGSTITIAGLFYMASATSGNVVLAAQLAMVSDADTSVTAKVYATENSSTVAVPGAAGTVKAFSITMSNADSAAAQDFFSVAFRRDADNGSDTATGDLNLLRLGIFFSLA